MVVLRVHAHLRLVGPVHLAVRGDVVAGIAAESLGLGVVRERQGSTQLRSCSSFWPAGIGVAGSTGR